MIRTCVVIAALMAAQVSAPASSAGLESGPFVENQRGAFAGLRVRASLGGQDREVRAGLSVAPTSHSRRGANSRMAVGEGLELGIGRSLKPELRLAGKRLDELSLVGHPAQDRAGLSTLATVAIVAGVVIVAGGLAFVHIANEASCFHGGGGCD